MTALRYAWSWGPARSPSAPESTTVDALRATFACGALRNVPVRVAFDANKRLAHPAAGFPAVSVGLARATGFVGDEIIGDLTLDDTEVGRAAARLIKERERIALRFPSEARVRFSVSGFTNSRAGILESFHTVVGMDLVLDPADRTSIAVLP
jgi:hypothetical protein